MRVDYNNALASLDTALSAVAEATRGVSSGASEIRQASDDLSYRTEQQAASLEETSAAMHQVTTAVRESASDANRADAAMQETSADAASSGDVVREAVAAMGGIERASAEIGEIIAVIDGIAFQTNLLALNAGVEAARAVTPARVSRLSHRKSARLRSDRQKRRKTSRHAS